MKAGKIIIYILLGLFALIFIIAALVPKSLSVEESVVINHPPEKVFPYGASLEHMLDWNPWSQTDPEAQNTFQGAPMEIGSKWIWKSEKLGKGSMEITAIEAPKKVVARLRFEEPNESVATDIRTFEATAEGTKITWINQSELSYPFERLVGLFMKGMLKQNQKQGLQNLKSYVNEQVNMNPVEVTLHIEGMTCTGCENTIKKRLGKLPGVMDVKASHQEAQAVVKVDSAGFNYPDFEEAIKEAGYTTSGIKQK